MIDSYFIMTNDNIGNKIDAIASKKHQYSLNQRSSASPRLQSGQSSIRRLKKTTRMVLTTNSVGPISGGGSCGFYNANDDFVTKFCKLPTGQIDEAQIVQAPQQLHHHHHHHHHQHQTFILDELSNVGRLNRIRCSSSSRSRSSSNSESNFNYPKIFNNPLQQNNSRVFDTSMSTKQRKRHRKRKILECKFDVNSMILLALFLFILPNCLVLLFKLPSIKETLASTNIAPPKAAKLYYNHNHNYNSNNNNNDDDGDTDLPSATQVSPNLNSPDDTGSYNTAGQGSSDQENFTQIPFEYNKLTTTGAAGSSSLTATQRPAAGAPTQAAYTSTKRVPILRVTESELLPFTEFNVQQPTFNDLIKSWPPTTRQAAYLASESANGASMPKYAVGSRQNPRIVHNSNNNNNRHKDDYSANGEANGLMRNYLNEDLDDTMVTADESFERDQMAEPPTMINYLGDLGDYIYVQLRQYFDNGGRTGSSSSRQNVDTSGAQLPPPNRVASDQDNESDRPPANKQQQQQQAGGATSSQLRIESIDELLDDHYYDQYENSQVLYYGPQLVREGDIFEIGCYMPNGQKAEWTKSGRVLLANKSGVSPRVIRRSDFLGAKQNYSLKVFEASPSDSGNYRCNRLSRKYHKLVVVPLKTTTTQLFVIQQRLLSVVNPKLVSVPQLASSGSSQRGSTTTAGSNPLQRYYGSAAAANRQSNRTTKRDYLLSGHLIVENQPLVVGCNITDEFVLHKLAENPKFQLAWYKNGKQLKGSLSASHLASSASQQQQSSAANSASYYSHSGNFNQSPGAIQVQVSPRQQSGQLQAASVAGTRARQQQQQQQSLATLNPSRPLASNQRIQFLQSNGRQLYITSALYSDAGDYLCSWSKLPAPQPQSGSPFSMEENGGNGDLSNSEENQNQSQNQQQQQQQQQQTIAANPLAAGSLAQLMAPVKLRPFKSTYHVRAGNELRLVCQVQRGYPSAHISWYVGNRLVDGEFLREHGDEFRVLQLQNQNQLIVTSTSGANGGEPVASSTGAADSSGDGSGGSGAGSSQAASSADFRKQIVEINPIPSGRQQMSMTANGRGQWIEYRDPRNEKYAIETPEQQLRYLKQKLAQLTGFSASSAASAGTASSPNQPTSAQAASAAATPAGQTSSTGTGGASLAAGGDPQAAALFSQTSISVLVINSLNIERHTARYACRATTRTNTDEATTVIRVQASSTTLIRPTSGRATLVPGQPLHFQCEMIANKNAQFLWYRRPLGETYEVLLEPNNDDTIEIHNERLTLLKPTLDMAGDFTCKVLKFEERREQATVKVRAQPYIEDFGQDTSHTGKSSTIRDGERLELICTVRDKITPVNITWLRSKTPDDDRTMVPLFEISPTKSNSDSFNRGLARRSGDDESLFSDIQTFLAQEQGIIIETLNEHSKKLVIESIKPEHRSHYGCIVDNGVTDRTRKVIFIRVKDKLVALWPFLGIVAELFILFTIIHVWETQRAYREVLSNQRSENRLLQQ